jgi:hypothetical protein
MAGPIEQLHYTWAARGAEGVNRFQIAALSSGLRSPAMGPLLPVIRKVCRYDRPQGGREGEELLPVSFGWFDHREHRVAFSRVGIPHSQDRRGNFAAHVIVAPAGTLSEADVASTFGSPFWWTGDATGSGKATESRAEEEGFQLPPIELEGLLRDRVEPPSAPPLAALALAQGLLSLPAEGRLSVLDHDWQFGPALRMLARRLPEALEGVSLSTYEAGSSNVRFDVIGTNRPASRARQCDLADRESLDLEARQLLEQLLGAGEEPERLRAAARGGAAQAGGRRGEALWQAAGRLRALTRSESAIDGPTAQAVATPNAILYLSRVPVGVANVAAAARGGGSAILAALRTAWEEMGGEPRDALCDALVESHLASGDLGGVAALAETLPDGPPRDAMLERVLRAARDDEGLARSLRADDAVLLVDRAARQGTSAAEAKALLRGTARHLGRCTEVSTLPRPYLVTMFRAALVDGGDDAALSATLLRHPALLAEVQLDEDERDRCLALLERLPPPRLERALPALLPQLAEPERRARLDAALRRLSTGSGGRVLVQAIANAREWAGAAPAVLSEMCDDAAVPLIAAGVAPLALELLDLSRSENGPPAADLLRATIVRSRGSALDAARGAAALGHSGLRAAIAERAMVCAIDEVRRPEEVMAVWRALADLNPGGGDGERLRLLLAYCRDGYSSGAAAAVLAWMASYLLAENPGLLSRGARLRDREAEDLANELVAGVFWHDMVAMEPAIERSDRRCRSWWKGLDAHRRKEAKRREREKKKRGGR